MSDLGGSQQSPLRGIQSHQQNTFFDNDDATPTNHIEGIRTEDLTSYSRKKSFDDLHDEEGRALAGTQQIYAEHHYDEQEEDLIDQVEFLKLEQQFSTQQVQNRGLDSEIRKSGGTTQSMKNGGGGAGSNNTSDTEENQRGFDSQAVIDKGQGKEKKRRLSRVDEEIKQHLQHSKHVRDTVSEYNHQLNKSNTTSHKDIKSQKDKNVSSKISPYSSKKKATASQAAVSTRSKRAKQHEQSTHSQAQKNQNPGPFDLNSSNPQLLQQNALMQQMMFYQQLLGFSPLAANPQLGQNQFQNPFIQGMNPYMMNPYMANSPQAFNQNTQFAPQQQQFSDESQKKAYIQQMLKQMKESNQIPPYLQENLEQQEQITQLILELEQENEQIQGDIQRLQEEQEKIHQDSINQQVQQRRIEIQEERLFTENNQNDVEQEDQENKINDNEDAEKKGNIEEEAAANNLNQSAEFGQQQFTQQSQQDQLINEQDLALREIALLAAQGQDPTPELERENQELEIQMEQLRRQERDLILKLTSLEYETEILFGKSNSMDHSVQNYGKRLEELGKQIEELTAILRIKDQEMIEMSSQIHVFTMQRETMRKDIVFRRQREVQIESNLKKVQSDLDKANYERENLKRDIENNMDQQVEIKEENKRLKTQIERLRDDMSRDDESYSQFKQKINNLSSQMRDLESRLFSQKTTIDRLRGESDQIKVDLTYQRATVSNQQEAYDKLNSYFIKQQSINQQLDSQLNQIMLNKAPPPLTDRSASSSIAPHMLIGQYLSQREDLEKPQREEKKVNFQIERDEIHQRSSSTDQRDKIQSRNFRRDGPQKLNDVSAQNSSRIKTILFDLTTDTTNDRNQNPSSITGQNRRASVSSQSRDFHNRNFVSQMQNILTWSEKQGGGGASTQDFSSTHENDYYFGSKQRINLNASQQMKTMDNTKRVSLPDSFNPNQSYNFGRHNRVISQNQSLIFNQQQSQQQQGEDSFKMKQDLIKDPAKLNDMKDEINVHKRRREKINAELNKVTERTLEGRNKKNNLENEMKDLNKKIGDLKQAIMKLDALKQGL